MNNNITTILTYVFLYLTVISLWIPQFKKIPLWGVMLVASILLGLVSHRLDLIALVFISLLATVTVCLGNPKTAILLRVLSATVILILSIGLGIHFFPGFHNLQVLNNIHISSDGIPFNLYLNFDKTIVGVFIIGCLHQRLATRSEWVIMAKAAIPRAIVVIFVVACLSFLFKFVWFDPKLPGSFILWTCTNLLFVCLAEEAFFRGFMQKYLCLVLQRVKFGALIAITLSSILFGLYHYAGGARYMLLATVAGFGYGWVYFRTQKIESSILTHFSLNLVHFLFFTYPALATGL
ncbi:MAG TPA: CPBP family intramembrane glutamic endopeptidase [Chthoniobacterales bacterium]|nr:CPBP family intramembrane glutamic endopeptidase [Chthoniobacterales bacterium]